MLIAMGLAWAWQPLAALIVGPIVYLGALAALRVIGADERRVFERLRGARSAEQNEQINESAASTI